MSDTENQEVAVSEQITGYGALLYSLSQHIYAVSEITEVNPNTLVMWAVALGPEKDEFVEQFPAVVEGEP